MDHRKLFVAGLAVWAVLAAQLIVLSIVAPEQARGMAAGLGAELLTGREGGVPVGLAAGAHPLLVWQTSFLQDIGTALLGYPLFLWALHKHHDKDWYVMRRLRLIEAKAGEHERFVERWGPIGLGAFMLLPFLVNGPFIAMVIGRLAGIPTKRLLLPVIVATVVTAAAWVFFFDTMFGLLNAVDDRLVTGLVVVAVSVVVLIGVVDFVRDHRAMKARETKEE